MTQLLSPAAAFPPLARRDQAQASGLLAQASPLGRHLQRLLLERVDLDRDERCSLHVNVAVCRIGAMKWLAIMSDTSTDATPLARDPPLVVYAQFSEATAQRT